MCTYWIHRDVIKIYFTHNSAINPFWHHDIGSHVSLFKFPSPYLAAGYSSQHNISLACCKSIKSNQMHKHFLLTDAVETGVWPFSLELSQTVTSYARLLYATHSSLMWNSSYVLCCYFIPLPDVLHGDLQVRKIKVWPYFTLNVLTVTRCH